MMEAVLTNPSGRMTLGSSVVRIGSAQDNHVVINDPKVAPYHAEIRPEGRGEYGHTLTDLGSTTGTFVNERRLDYNVPSLLRPNDIIHIGDAVFNYEVTGTPQMRAPQDFPDRVPDQWAGTRPPTPPTPPRPAPPGTTPAPTDSGPDRLGAAGPSPLGINPSLPHGWLQGPPPHDAATPVPAYSGHEEIDRSSAQGPYAPYVSQPTGGIAPASPFGSISPKKSSGLPASTLASLLEKENRRKLWLAGGLTALVILLVAFLFGSFHSPGRTLDTFCSALQSGNYQAAYDQLSPGLQGTVNEASFANSFTGNGRITSCTHSSPNVSGNGAEATISTNSNPASTVWLIQDSNSNWRIDSLSGL